MYKTDIFGASSSYLTCISAINYDSLLWHQRLGHAIIRQLNKLASKDLVIGLPRTTIKDDNTYNTCVRGKQARYLFKMKNLVSTTKYFDLVHMDLYGPMKVRSKGGKRCIYVLLYDYSRFFWNLFLASKKYVFDIFSNIFKNNRKNNLGKFYSRSDEGV